MNPQNPQSMEPELHRKNVRTAWIVGIYLCIAYIFFGLLLFLAWDKSNVFSFVGLSWNATNSGTFQKVIYAISAGGLGTVTFNFWNLYVHYCKYGDFDTKYSLWYVFGPINGSLVGIAAYGVVVAGLLVFAGTVNLSDSWALFGVCYLAGFSSRTVLLKLNSIAEEIFQKETITPNRLQ